MEEMRKEVRLHPEIIKVLQRLADKKGWSVKKYMEYTLTTRAVNTDPSLKSKIPLTPIHD